MTEPKVKIRPMQLGDTEAVQSYTSDERVVCRTRRPEPYPADGGETFVKEAVEVHANGAGFYFAILADGELIGTIKLHSIDHENCSGEYGYPIAASHWGKGIATKVVALALRFAFCELGMDVVRPHCLKRNPASARVSKRIGIG